MLKKQLEKQLAAANIIISNMKSSAEVDRDLIKRAADKEGRHTKLKRHVDKALCAIEAILSVNCPDEQNWEIVRHDVLTQCSFENKEPPPEPEFSMLYKSLCHIDCILKRTVEEQKEDHVRRFR